jgi:hypothetical protein
MAPELVAKVGDAVEQVREVMGGRGRVGWEARILRMQFLSTFWNVRPVSTSASMSACQHCHRGRVEEFRTGNQAFSNLHGIQYGRHQWADAVCGQQVVIVQLIPIFSRHLVLKSLVLTRHVHRACAAWRLLAGRG